jgi:hypothetical protein
MEGIQNDQPPPTLSADIADPAYPAASLSVLLVDKVIDVVPNQSTRRYQMHLMNGSSRPFPWKRCFRVQIIEALAQNFPAFLSVCH